MEVGICLLLASFKAVSYCCYVHFVHIAEMELVMQEFFLEKVKKVMVFYVIFTDVSQMNHRRNTNK